MLALQVDQRAMVKEIHDMVLHDKRPQAKAFDKVNHRIVLPSEPINSEVICKAIAGDGGSAY
jgi:hypothetical protein